MSRHELIWVMGTLLGLGAVLAAFTLGLSGSGVGFLGFALVTLVILAARDVVGALHHQSVRKEAMLQAANRLGFSFRETAPVNVLGWPHSIRLTQDAMKLQQATEQSGYPSCGSLLLPTSRNVLEGTMDGAGFAVFDYECDISPTNDATIRQTVFAARSADLPTFQFSLVPASSWDRLFRRSGALPDGRRLISDWTVQIGDLDERLLRCVDRQMILEAGGGCMLLYRRDRLVAPEELDNFVARGMQIYSLLCEMKLAKDQPA